MGGGITVLCMVLHGSSRRNCVVTLCKYTTTPKNAICDMNKCARASVNVITFVLVYTHRCVYAVCRF